LQKIKKNIFSLYIKANIQKRSVKEQMKFTRIVRKKYQQYKGKVYDLTVEDSHSYNIDNLVVHNSGAGSLVCYATDITKVDPIEYDLIFERMSA
jgi:DNA polymerase III alpha subunit